MWPSTLSIYKDNYSSKKEYQQALAEARAHYGYEVRVSGGYMFFEYVTDYETWKRQK